MKPLPIFFFILLIAGGLFDIDHDGARSNNISFARREHGSKRRQWGSTGSLGPAGIRPNQVEQGIPAIQKYQLTESFGRLPISFVENRNQSAQGGMFLARGPNYLLSMAPGEVSFMLKSLVGRSGLTLPVIVETNSFDSELVLANFSPSSKTLHFSLLADAIRTSDATANFDITLSPSEQTMRRPERIWRWLTQAKQMGVQNKTKRRCFGRSLNSTTLRNVPSILTCTRPTLSGP